MARALSVALVLLAACARGPRCPAVRGDIWTSQELLDARQADYDGKYDLALKKVAQYLKYHGGVEEALAWEIRGSTDFLMGKTEEARAAWATAYRLDPCLSEIPDLLKKLDAKP